MTDIQSAPGADPAPPHRYQIVRADLRLAGAGPLVISVTALAALSILFVRYPEIDLAVSGWFYSPGEGFELKRSGCLGALRVAGRVLPVVVAVAAAALLVAALFTSLAGRTGRTGRPAHSVFLLSTLALGPGLIVNAVLKNNWGRARPRETLEFGGEWPFTPAWFDPDHCVGNCSFVSGEAAAAFWLVALAFVVPAAMRARILAVTLSFAIAVSVNRVLYGAHFLSDIVLAWAIMTVVFAILAKLCLGKAQAAALDHGFHRLVRRPARIGRPAG